MALPGMQPEEGREGASAAMSDARLRELGRRVAAGETDLIPDLYRETERMGGDQMALLLAASGMDPTRPEAGPQSGRTTRGLAAAMLAVLDGRDVAYMVRHQNDIRPTRDLLHKMSQWSGLPKTAKKVNVYAAYDWTRRCRGRTILVVWDHAVDETERGDLIAVRDEEERGRRIKSMTQGLSALSQAYIRQMDAEGHTF